MNKLTKIGVSALAGSLALTAANALEMSVSGSAGGAMYNYDESNSAGGFYQFDSVVFSASGETDGGMTVSASMELDNDNPATGAGMDNRSFSFGSDSMGTVTFSGHGGVGVMGAWDDITPNAYEEVWDGTSGADSRIDGRSGNNLLAYTSPSFSGVVVKAAYQRTAADTATGNGTDVDAYNDWGIQYSPEMVDGLTVAYGEGTLSDTASTEIEHSTVWIKYVTGGLTVAYQEHEADGSTAAKSDESETFGISYAVSDDLTIAYGQRDYDDDTSDSTATSQEQEDSGFSISYTSGGMTIAGHMNESENVSGVATADKDAYEIALSFAF
jgi:outer membrane protein OmpU